MLNRFKRDSKTALDAAFYLRFDMVMLNLMVGFLSGLMIIATEYIMAMWVLDSRPTMLPAWAVSWVSFSIWNYGAFNAARERIGESINTSRGRNSTVVHDSRPIHCSREGPSIFSS